MNSDQEATTKAVRAHKQPEITSNRGNKIHTAEGFIQTVKPKSTHKDVGTLMKPDERLRNQGRRHESEADQLLRSVLTDNAESPKQLPESENAEIKYSTKLHQIQENYPWITPDRCTHAVLKFDGNIETAREWLLTTMSEDDVKHLEVRVVTTENGYVIYRSKATQTKEGGQRSLGWTTPHRKESA